MVEGYRGKARRPAASRGDDVERHQKPEERSSTGQRDTIHGEGNYKAAREFDDAERQFVQSGKLDEAIRSAPPKSEHEKREMEKAEEQARARAREEDPALLAKPQTKREAKR